MDYVKLKKEVQDKLIKEGLKKTFLFLHQQIAEQHITDEELCDEIVVLATNFNSIHREYTITNVMDADSFGIARNKTAVALLTLFDEGLNIPSKQREGKTIPKHYSFPQKIAENEASIQSIHAEVQQQQSLILKMSVHLSEAYDTLVKKDQQNIKRISVLEDKLEKNKRKLLELKLKLKYLKKFKAELEYANYQVQSLNAQIKQLKERSNSYRPHSVSNPTLPDESGTDMGCLLQGIGLIAVLLLLGWLVFKFYCLFS